MRERQILGMIAGGESGAQIAETLVLSPETVRTHIRNAMSKLGASSRAQAVALAFQRNEIGDQADADSDAAAPPARSRALRRRDGPRRATRAPGRPRGREVRRDAGDAARGLVSLYDVDGGTVFLAEEDGLSLRRAATQGASDEDGDHHHPERVSLGQGTLGRAALERRAQLVHGSGSQRRRPRPNHDLRADDRLGKAGRGDLPDDAAEQAHRDEGSSAAAGVREPGRRDPGLLERRSARAA